MAKLKNTHMPKKIAMFKPGVKSFHYAALDNFDQDTHPDRLDYLHMRFRDACQKIFNYDLDPVWDTLCERLQRHDPLGRIVLAHASTYRPHALTAAYAVWTLLCNRSGRAFIFSPDIATLAIARQIIDNMLVDNPGLLNMLEFDALSVRLRAAPERRIEWVLPDMLTDDRIRKMAGCNAFVFVDAAHQCANELLESLRDTLFVAQSAVIAGVPMSAQGAFKALYDDPAFVPMKLSAQSDDGFHVAEAEKVRAQSGEDSDFYRSTVLAEFPQT